MSTPGLAPCPDCRALVPDVDGPTHPYLGASPGCWAAWGDLQARGYAEPALRAEMPVAVDAYAAQHPGVRGRRQAQSVWCHLVSICLVVERGWTPAQGIRAKQRLLEHDAPFPWLEPPIDPGAVTVLDVATAPAPASASLVRTWARSVWDAWVAHHAAIRSRADELAPG